MVSNSILLRNPYLRCHCSIIESYITRFYLDVLHFDLIFDNRCRIEFDSHSMSITRISFFDCRYSIELDSPSICIDTIAFFDYRCAIELDAPSKSIATIPLFDYRYRIELKSRSKSTIPLFNYRYRIELDSPSMSFSVQTHFSIIDIASNSNLLRYPSLRSLFSIIGFVSNSTSPLIFVTTLPCFDYRCRIGFASITVSSADALGQNRNPCLKLFNCSSRSCRNGPRGQGREGRKRSTDRTDGDLDRPRSSADMI